MASINKVILIGRLGRDPEVRYAPSGDAVTNFSIATSENWKDKNTGEKKERTEWHKLVTFRRLAEVCAEYLAKGSLIYIEGKLQTRDWDDKEGNKRYTTEIVVNQMQMLGGRGDSDSGDYSRPADQKPSGKQQSQPKPNWPEPEDENVPF